MNKQDIYKPFPGLKAYSLKDSKYFCGRDRQKLQLLKIIAESNFVAVVGSNGVGKTSFINSEIVPELMQGFLSNGKSNWKIVSFRPGKNPPNALATALSQVDVVRSSDNEKIDPNLSDRFENIIREKNYAVIEIVEQYKLVEHNNLLIYIDHLDDLLLYSGNSELSKRDIKIFIDRLVEVVNQSAYSITVIATLRTEITGHFSIYPELAEIINKNQFLLSAYEARDLMPIFERITKEGVATFDNELLKHIQTFYKSNPLILGEFQHAMKRSIDEWHRRGGIGSVGMEHLKAVGGLNATIGYQLDHIYGYMSKSDKLTCKLLFQAITETSVTDTSFSAPRTIREISNITGRSSDEIVQVARQFTDESCGVIKRYDAQDITGRLEYLDHSRNLSENLITEHSEITVAQDFLLVEWPRLNKWIKEEYLNSNIYRDIAKDAEQNSPHYEGEKLLATWRWYEDVQPHAGWAQRYSKNFDLVEDFILKSKKLSDRERDRRESEELSRQQKSKRNRNIKLVFSLVALLLTIFAFVKTREASEEADIALQQKEIAEAAEIQAQKASDEAAYEKRTAELSIRQASLDRELAQKAMDSAEMATERARIAKQEAMLAQRKAQDLRAEANKLTKTVQTKTNELSKAEEKIEESKLKEEYLGILEAVRESSDEAMKILTRTNNAQQRKEAAKIASNGYEEFQKINLNKYRDIRDTTKEHTQKKLFSALTLAYQNVGGSKELRQINYGIAISENGTVGNKGGSGEFIIGTNDANSSIFKISVKNGIADVPNKISSVENSEKKIFGIRELSYSNSAKHFVVSHLPIDQKNRYISKYDADGNISSTIEMPSLVESIHPYQENNFLAADQNGSVYLIDAASPTLKSDQLYSPKEELRGMDFYEPKGQLFLALSNRKVVLISVTNGKAVENGVFVFNEFESEISAIKYLGKRGWLLIGTRNGEFYIYDFNSKKCIYKSLHEHAANINCLVVSDNENMLVSGGRDKIINIWDLEQLAAYTLGKSNEDREYQPIEFDEGESIRDVTFLDENWILVVYSTEGLSSGRGGASLLPLDFDITGRELQKIVE